MAPRVKKPDPKGRSPSVSKGANKKDKPDKRKREGKAAPKRAGRGRRKGDKAKDRLSKTTLKLKGWLATEADWKRFNAWASINALPKQFPEPEPIVRPSKPLCLLQKRLKMLAQPREAVDPSINCKLDFSVSKAALNAVPSIRTKLLAIPVIKLVDYGRVYYQVSPAALTYEPSERILQLSQPTPTIVPEKCKPPAEKPCRGGLDKERLKKLAMKKKLLNCPEQLTEEELKEFFTPLGTPRSALVYEITPWMEFLALPMYKKIKPKKDEPAVTWKKTIITELETRGKEAMREYKKKRAKEREKEKKMERLRKKKAQEEEERKKKEKEEEMERRRKLREKYRDRCEPGDTTDYEEEKPEEKDEKKKKVKRKTKERKSIRDDGDAKKTDDSKEKLSEEEKKKMQEEEEKRQKKRKKRKNAWRFAKEPLKEDPFSVKKEALKVEVSPRTTELATPNVHKCKSLKANPFSVKKGALSVSPSGRIESLAKPNRPRSPIERKPPREKDAYGKPIFVVPVYVKELPKTKPYKMGECPKKEDEEEKKKKKKKKHKKRPIDPIAFEPTYDPCAEPELAKKQKRERKRAEKLSPKKKDKRRKQKSMSLSDTSLSEDKAAEIKEEEEEGEGE